MSGNNFSCLLVGGQALLLQCAGELQRRGHTISAIVSNDQDVVGPAGDLGVKIIENGPDLRDKLANIECDYLLSIVNLSISPDFLIRKPKIAAINFHDGILPDFAGLNVPCWALLSGAREHGVTWHEMTADVDKGQVYVQSQFPVADGQTAFALNAQCFEQGFKTFQELLDGLEDQSLLPQPQADRPGRYFSRSDRPDHMGVVDWDQPAVDIVRRVNALDFGGFADNPVTAAKTLCGSQILLLSGAQDTGEPSSQPAGTAVMAGSAIRVASSSNDLLLQSVTTPDGQAFEPTQPVRLNSSDIFRAEQYAAMCSRGKFESVWVKRLANLQALDLPWLASANSDASSSETFLWQPPAAMEADALWAVHAAFFARLANVNVADLAWNISAGGDDLPDELYARAVPLRLQFDFADTLTDVSARLTDERAKSIRRGRLPKDLLGRYRSLKSVSQSWISDHHSLMFCETASSKESPAGGLSLQCESGGTQMAWRVSTDVLSAEDVGKLQRRLTAFCQDLLKQRSVGEATLLDAQDQASISRWNQTSVELPAAGCIHHQIERQADATPDAVATQDGFQTLTYRELNEQSNQLAHWLIAQGVTPEDRIGIYLPRSSTIQMVMLAILKAGGAYVPLDPEYPTNRIAHVVADSDMRFAITQGLSFEAFEDRRVDLNEIKPQLQDLSKANPEVALTPANLAYAIYTSGSTGLPKGVLVEHGNVVNFFAGMDQRIESRTSDQSQGVWLAVTSMSFDISVLELLWTLARGFNVVVHGGQQPLSGKAEPSQNLQLSLFFWNHVNESDLEDPEKYRLLTEAAKFADDKGFLAIWTPERHFGAFGGSYPNPAVVSAAIASITENLQIRAGSVVAPLHSPIRIAEDWSIVDNLSGGRVGVSFASGWQPNDFVIRPQGFDNAKQQMLDAIDEVQALWRGETREFEGPKGPVAVKTLPRPIQPKLPVWLTTAGNPESFKAAGKKGVNLLTHLLGQSVEGVGENIALYRQAWREAGHAGNGHVTLMLHTLVGEEGDTGIKEKAREPMKSYLKSAMFLVKDAAWEFPTFKKMSEDGDRKFDDIFAELANEDLDALLDFAFERYYNESGLFGTPDRCLETLQSLQDIGIDEVGCLIDFGLENDQVLAHLPALAALIEKTQGLARHAQTAPMKALSDQIIEHGVSHLQCTPSQAVVATAEPGSSEALAALDHLMVGGEALPRTLAQKLAETCTGRVTNMYGPTETTIWSSTWALPGQVDEVLIGEPIANTEMLVVDAQMQMLPPGCVGELVIGGKGVVRGYHNRAELTTKQFVSRTSDSTSGPTSGRLYRTGDQARFDNGRLVCLGRSDNQVKIRGYRIELGEIESVLEQRDEVTQSVVVLREDREDDLQLVAYLLADSVKADVLKVHLQRHLPEFMVPSTYVQVDSFPTTPNGKIDRSALQPPDQRRSATEPFQAPESGLEEKIGSVWISLLDSNEIGINDNFFEIGGHSLLAVKMQAELTAALEQPVSIIDIFQYPTIRLLAASLGKPDAPVVAASGSSRASRRKAARPRR